MSIFKVSPERTHSVWNTPLYEQFWRNKDKAPRALLFFRLGDFYELFGDDAIKAAPILGIQLTARNKKAETPIPMCGVPVHAIEGYTRKLLDQGLRIALCEQIGQVTKTKLVERDITRIVSPGFPLETEELNTHSWLMSVVSSDTDQFEIFFYDFLLKKKKGPFKINSFEDLVDRIRFYKPCEIVLSKDQTALSQDIESMLGAQWPLLISSVGSSQKQESAFELFKCFFKATQFKEYNEDLSVEKGYLQAHVDAQVLEQWDIETHVFEFFNRCQTAVGRRHLKTLLMHPLSQSKNILERQQFFKAIEKLPCLDELREFLRSCYDLERIMGRLTLNPKAYKEFYRFVETLRAASSLEKINKEHSLNEFWKSLGIGGKSSNEFLEFVEDLNKKFQVDVDLMRIKDPKELLVISGFDELKKVFEEQEKNEKWLETYQQELREKYKIPSLKIKYSKVLGYFIEITKTHLSKIKGVELEKKQSTLNSERFTSKTLKEKELAIRNSFQRFEEELNGVFVNMRDQILSFEEEISRLSEMISWLDVAQGVEQIQGKMRRYGDWVYPELIDEKTEQFQFEFNDSRHPLVEHWQNGDFVSNSISLRRGEFLNKKLFLITGPNMAGKSTLMRQTGLLLLLSQCAFPVPCVSASLSPCDSFYSRMGASDDLRSGQSTFMVEMKETANILKKAGKRSFILIDEVGRGTSTEDGRAIAEAILKYLHDKTDSLCLFATHFHHLSEIVQEFPQAENISLEIKEHNGAVVFMRKMLRKAAESSYGLHVCRLAGIPEEVIVEAGLLMSSPINQGIAAPQMSLFNQNGTSEDRLKGLESRLEHYQNVIKKIEAIEMDELSPRTAWTELDKVVKLSRNRIEFNA